MCSVELKNYPIKIFHIGVILWFFYVFGNQIFGVDKRYRKKSLSENWSYEFGFELELLQWFSSFQRLHKGNDTQWLHSLIPRVDGTAITKRNPAQSRKLINMLNPLTCSFLFFEQQPVWESYQFHFLWFPICPFLTPPKWHHHLLPGVMR